MLRRCIRASKSFKMIETIVQSPDGDMQSVQHGRSLPVGFSYEICRSLACYDIILFDKRSEFVEFETGFCEVCFEKRIDGLMTGRFFYMCRRTSAAETRKFV